MITSSLQKTKGIGRSFQFSGRINALVGKLFAVCMYRGTGLMVLLVIFVIGILPGTSFERVLREDAYVYVTKALEIVNGDFTPPHGNCIGWPLLLASVFATLQINDLFTGMFVARWVSIACVCASMVMIYAVTKRLVNAADKYQIAATVAVCAFMAAPHTDFIARNAMTEPLFMFLTLTSIYFLVDDLTTTKNIAFSSVFASLAYYVRPNGIFFLGVILALLMLRALLDKALHLKLFLCAIMVFFLVSMPHMINRYQAYGSPFSYGENAKYFVENTAQLWAPNIKAPTFREYLETHTWSDYHDKFIQNGLLAILKSFYQSLLPVFWSFVLFVSFIQYVFFKRNPRYDVLFICLFVSVVGLTPVFDVFSARRHLIYLTPIILITSTGFLSSLDGNSPVKFSNVVLFIVLLCSLNAMPWRFTIDTSHFKTPEIRDNWAVWAAQHIKGNIVIVEGGDILKSAQHYSEFTHKRKTILPFDQVDRKITTIRPGIYESMEDALVEFEEMGVNYVIVDGFHSRIRPYLAEIQNDQWAARFRHLNYFKRRARGGVLYEVNIYEFLPKS